LSFSFISFTTLFPLLAEKAHVVFTGCDWLPGDSQITSPSPRVAGAAGDDLTAVVVMTHVHRSLLL